MTLCKVCDELDIHGRDSRLGVFTEIVARAADGCGGCRFFCDILQTSMAWRSRLSDLDDKIIFLSSKRLDVRNPGNVDGSSYSCDDLLFDYCAHEDDEASRDEETDSRRIIPVYPTDKTCLDQIQTWTSECSEHDNCPRAVDTTLPKMIIEISSDPEIPPKLIPSEGKKGQYLVLSHCKGGIDQLDFIPTMGENIEIKSLPKTLADAMEMTRELGYKHIWIRSLCTFQNNEVGASEVAAIYCQAALMISADRAENVDTGFLGPRKIYYSPALGKQKDRYLRLNLLRWKWDMENSPLAKEAWAAQERFLAPRIVHYTERQMIWECPAGIKFEASGIPDLRYGSGQIRMHYRKSYVQPFFTEALKRQQDVGSERPNTTSDMDDLAHRLEAWHQCVDDYASRSVTVPLDKLPGISSTASILDDGTLGTYIAGLWSKHINIGLAWSRARGVLQPSPTYRAPSWSWASVEGDTSSLYTTYPENYLKAQRDSPAWMEKYGPRLISNHVVPLDASDPYQGVKEGSYIVLDSKFIGLQNLLEAVNTDSDNTFYPTVALDQNWISDCQECAGHPHSEEEVKTEAENLAREMEEYVCIIVAGAFAFNGTEGAVDLMIVKRMPEVSGGMDDLGENAWVRVGFMRLSLGFASLVPWKNEDDTINEDFVAAKFDSLGWERKTMRLF